jgi:alkylation response protein AidB-like acyl-CoA dehydrogenase
VAVIHNRPPLGCSASGAAPVNPVLTLGCSARHLAAVTARRSTITRIYECTNQIQRMVMARQLLK